MAPSKQLFDSIQALVRKAPENWLASACESIRTSSAGATADFIQKRMPETNNAVLGFMMSEVLRFAQGAMSWEALSWTVQSAYQTYHGLRSEQHIEFLWSGPSPDSQIAARRIDQALYDLIANAKREILLVTFAAAKIDLLAKELLKAVHRGIKVRLVLEFAESSEGQLSFDALKAFPKKLVDSVTVYHWPVEMRERNAAGKPGKLHAKLAIIDDVVLISSANLTDDALSRNLEMGIMVRDPRLLQTTLQYIENLMAHGILLQMK